jgi:hypothetical protein
MGKEKAFRMQQKIEALETLSKRCQLMCKKGPADSKRCASAIYQHLLQARKPWKQVQDTDIRKLCKQIDNQQPLKLSAGKSSGTEPWMASAMKGNAPMHALNMTALKTASNNEGNRQTNQEESEQDNEQDNQENNQQNNQQEDAKDLWCAIELARAEEERVKQEHQKKARDAQRDRLKMDLAKQNKEQDVIKRKQKQQKQAELQAMMQDVEKFKEEERKATESKHAAEQKLYKDLVQQKMAYETKAQQDKQKKKQDEQRFLQELAWLEQRKAQQDVVEQQKDLEEWKQQNVENERLIELKKRQRQSDLREAQALQDIYIQTEDANDRRREKALHDRSAAVQAKMSRFSTKGAGKQDDNIAKEIEARANREQQRRNRMEDEDEQKRIQTAERRLAENNKVIARQVQERQAKRAVDIRQQQEQARKFTNDEEQARAERERTETSRRKSSQETQRRWLQQQVMEKKERANGIMELTDMSMNELKLNKELLARTVSRTAHLKNKAQLQQVITRTEPDARSNHRRARAEESGAGSERSSIQGHYTTRPW